MTSSPQWQNQQIPRHPRWGGPLVIPPDATHKPGEHQCPSCRRMVAPNRGKSGKPVKTGKGTCKCEYYKRATNFIDVIQDEFKLKQWDRRMVAYGMSQRPDLVLSATTVMFGDDGKPDEAGNRKLQQIADDAKDYAKAGAAATTGTSLHTLTEWMDTGRDLGYVPEPYPADLKAYAEATKDIEWVDVESFRVFDDWKVAGTTDRIGWYKGRLRIFDIKTGGLFFEGGPAMQLAMYARSTKYDIATDTRQIDFAPIDLGCAFIIHLPAGKGECTIKSVDIAKGWGGCRIAKQVWDFRNNSRGLIGDDDDRIVTGATYFDMAARAGTTVELRMLWKRAKEQCVLSPELKELLQRRATELGDSK